MATTPAVHQVNLLALLLPLPQEQGDLASTPTGDEVPHAKDSFARQLKPNGRSTSCASSPHLLLQPRRNRKEQRSLKSILIDDNGTPATWTFGLVFQQAIDRQDRTLQSRRTLQLYWNYTGDIITAWYTGILHRTRTRCNDDMPCRHPPLRLQTLQERRDKPKGPSLTPRRKQTSHRLRAFASHRSPRLLHQSSRLTTTTGINHRMAT